MATKKKSLFVAYSCWALGGLFGLHHFYLERDFHAFITFATLGGYFTLGLIRDLWCLPEYVREANNDLNYLEALQLQMKQYKRPPSSQVRYFGQMIVGNLLAYLVEYALPHELLSDITVAILRFLLIPLASAVGVWMVGNVGRHQGSIRAPLLASYLLALLSVVLNMPHGSFSTLGATIAFNKFSKEWRSQKRKPRSLIFRLAFYTICVALYLSLWTSWLYFGCSIEDPETNESIKCRVALENFFNSPAYENISEAVWMLVEHVRHQGLSGLWSEMMQQFDVTGKSSALSTLGLDENASPKEIIAQYKRLSREYHPDKEKDETKKAEKQEKFIEVQEAYRKLETSVNRYRIQDEL